MHFPTTRFIAAAIGLLFAGCATRSLPKYEKPLARSEFQTVRTTAYTHTEADHRKYGKKNALGTRLQFGAIRSAAADWSRYPAGTVFRVQETGNLYRVDDYGWALTGTNTIDLYKPSRAAMNRWGVRRVNIQILNWGDPNRSLSILRPRSKHKHVRTMISQLEDRRSELQRPLATSASLAATNEPTQFLTPFTN
jgi:3D (Asp-Asp-Asp) domain-containing protein